MFYKTRHLDHKNLYANPIPIFTYWFLRLLFVLIKSIAKMTKFLFKKDNVFSDVRSFGCRFQITCHNGNTYRHLIALCHHS